MDPIVRRWKQSAVSSWYEDAPVDIDLDSVESYIREGVRLVKGYKAKCTYLAGIYRGLAGPLETPVIATYADRMKKI